MVAPAWREAPKEEGGGEPTGKQAWFTRPRLCGVRSEKGESVFVSASSIESTAVKHRITIVMVENPGSLVIIMQFWFMTLFAGVAPVCPSLREASTCDALTRQSSVTRE